MTWRVVRWTLVALLVAMHVPAGFGQTEQTRRVYVKVELRDFEGKPISNLAIRVRDFPDGATVDVVLSLRADGSGVLAVDVPQSCEVLEAVPEPLHHQRMRIVPEFATRDEFLDLIRHNSFQNVYPLRLAPDRQEYVLTIRAEEAITISGRLVDVDGKPVSGMISVPDWLCFSASRFDRTGTLDVLGVPKDRPVELVLCGTHEQVKVVTLTAEQTADDFDLGEVTLEPMTGSAAVRLMDSNPLSFEPGGHRHYTLISEDGQTVLRVLVADPSGRPSNVTFRTSESWLAPGRYYLAPRSLGQSRDARQLLRLIRDGRAGAHPGLKSFVAIADRDIEVAFDAEDVVGAIREAARAEYGEEAP